MKDLMIGTNSAVEVLETGGGDEEYWSGNGPITGATDVLKSKSFSSENDDRPSKVGKPCPITRHQRLFRSDESSAYLPEARLVFENAVYAKWGSIPRWKVILGMMGRWW